MVLSHLNEAQQAQINAATAAQIVAGSIEDNGPEFRGVIEKLAHADAGFKAATGVSIIGTPQNEAGEDHDPGFRGVMEKLNTAEAGSLAFSCLVTVTTQDAS